MKINEVFEGLIKNNNATYQTFKNGRRYELSVLGGFFRFEVFRDTGEMISQNCGAGGFTGNIQVGDEWELVQTPVSWEEAIRAWADGKAVEVVMPHIGKLRWSRDFTVGFFNSEMITKGKWFIKEECN